MIMIEGRLQTRSWEGQDGKKNYRTEIVAEAMQMGPRQSGGRSQFAESQEGSQTDIPQSKGFAKEELETVEYPVDEIKPEDIPF